MSDPDFTQAAIKAQAARIRELEQQVRNLGGDPHKAKEVKNEPKNNDYYSDL